MLDFPSTGLNRQAIVKVLEEVFDSSRSLHFLEVASGSGQHVHYFAERFPNWSFQPSDLEPLHLESIRGYSEAHSLANVKEPVLLDASAAAWPLDPPFDGLLVINMVHISPWEATLGVFEQGSKLLSPGGRIYLYGAYQREGGHTSASNEAFHRSLQSRNPLWGVRHLERVQELAKENGLECEHVIQMPANNLSVVFRRPI